MIPALIVAGVLLTGGVLLVANWDEVVDWLRDFIPKLKETWARVRPHVPYEAQIFGDMVVKGAEELVSIIHKVYYQEESGQWMEETTTRKVNESEVPAYIREKILKKKQQGEQANITHEMELEMAS